MPQLQPGKPWLLFADPDTLLPYQLAQREDMIQGLLILGGLAIALLLVVLLPILLMRRYEKNPPKEFTEEKDAPPVPDPAPLSAPLPEVTLSTAEKLQTLRRSRGLSQEQLANQLNISRQAISKWELGDSFPDAENLLALSRLYGVSIDYILNPDWIQPPAAAPAPVPFWKKAVDWFGWHGHYIGYGITGIYALTNGLNELTSIAMEAWVYLRWGENIFDDPVYAELVTPNLPDRYLTLVMMVAGLLLAKCCRSWQKKQKQLSGKADEEYQGQDTVRHWFRQQMAKEVAEKEAEKKEKAAMKKRRSSKP